MPPQKHTLTFGKRTLVMGILNVTPDSFSDGGKYFSQKEAAVHAKKMVADGADIIDVGGESTRPGSAVVSAEEELKRVIPAIKSAADLGVPISIDTSKPQVAKAALEAGATIVNDVYGLRQDGMVDVAAGFGCRVVIMHMQGTPKTMQVNPTYRDVVGDIKDFFNERIVACEKAGVKKKNIIIDPGVGFGKTLQHNIEIIRRLQEFKSLGCPVLVGVSRKRFIGDLTGLPTEERLEGTIAAVTACVLNGADVVRVHDVKECVHAVKIADSIARIKV
ncbi:Pterin binding enzyme [uncultured archaeon]|nr:Pterin binding enzyme [uncultured archaeon]